MSMLPELASWVRGLEKDTRAPAGQPNLVSENYGEIAAFMEAVIDTDNATTRRGQMQAMVKVHNDDIVATCLARRANATTPCGGKTAVRCADCPRTLGLTCGNRTISG